MINTNEGNGIFGYENSKHKKIKKNLFDFDNYADSSATPLSDEQRHAMSDAAKMAGEQLARDRAQLNAPLDKEAKMAQYRKTATNFLIPSANDETRRRRLFATSERTINEAADTFFKDNVKDIFQEERSSAESEARNEYSKYTSLPGNNHMVALGATRRASDPEKVIERTMQNINTGELDNIAKQYAHYAGLSPESYRKELLEPAIREKMYKEYVNDATPQSSAEFIARKAYDDSIVGKLVDINLNAHSQTNSQSLIDREGLASYDANRLENLAAGIGSLAIDMPIFSGIGAAASSTVKGVQGIAKGLSSTLLKKYAPKGMQSAVADRVVEKAIKSKMASKIAGSSATQALTLGGYDAGNTIADQLLANDGIDVEKVVKAYGHGLATGAAVGLVGTPLKMKTRGLTGGKKVAASMGVLGAESAVFTASSEIQKLNSGVDVEPIDLLYDFGESAATLGAMRLAHWRPKGGYAKLGANGKLKKEFEFTPAEQKEMSSAGIEPSIFITQLEGVLNTNLRTSVAHRNDVKNMYLQMMGSDKLKLSTRSKLFYLVENKITSTPPVPVDYNVEELPNGNYKYSLLDANGRRIETQDNISYNELQNTLLRTKGVLRRNKIAQFETELLGDSDADNFFRQAGEYARENNITTENIVNAMFKKCNAEELTPQENNMLEKISQRASYGDSRVGYMLKTLRSNLEKKYNLDEGSLLEAVNRRAYLLSPQENRALDEYLNSMRKEVDLLKSGVNGERVAELDKGMQESSYGDLTNYESKLREHRKYVESNLGYDNKSIPGLLDVGETMTFPIKVPNQWNKPYMWSFYGLKNTPVDILRYENRARELANNLGYAIKFVRDERSIPFDELNVDEYNNKIRSSGWLDNQEGKVYINLPNIRNMHDLEKTVVHEMIGHGGLSNLFGEYLYEFYDTLYKQAGPALRNEFHKIANKYDLHGYAAIEEYLAALSEKNAPTPQEAAILNKYKQKVGEFLVEKRLYSPDNKNLTTEDLKDFLTAHHEAMLAKKRPNDYRASLLDKFPDMKEMKDFYNHEGYNQYMREKYHDRKKALDETPDFLLDDKLKLFSYLDYDKNVNQPSSYRFIGKRGARNLARSEYRDMLIDPTTKRAEQMERDGASSEEIWLRTGWERGADGEWRTEIGDYDKIVVRDLNQIMLNHKSPTAGALYNIIKRKPIERLNEGEIRFLTNVYRHSNLIFKGYKLKLRDLVGDSPLFSSYPDIANMPVVVTHKVKTPTRYDVIKNKLYVNSKSLSHPEILKDDILVTLQKMVQDREGFSRSIDLMRADLEGRIKEYYNEANDIAKTLNKLNEPKTKELYEEYAEKFKKVYKIHPAEFETYYPSGNEYILKLVYNQTLSPAGDVETRNVLYRQNLTPEELRNIAPSETEDVPRFAQVIDTDMRHIRDVLSGPIDIIKRGFRDEGLNLYEKFVSNDEQESFFDFLSKMEPANFLPPLGEFVDKNKKKYGKAAMQYMLDNPYDAMLDFEGLDKIESEIPDLSEYYNYDRNGTVIPIEKELWADENNIKPQNNTYKKIRNQYIPEFAGEKPLDDDTQLDIDYDAEGKPRLKFNNAKYKKKEKLKNKMKEFLKKEYDIDLDENDDDPDVGN